MSDINNVFLPHRHEDDALVGAFKDLMKSKGVEIRDSSITRDKPNQARSPDYIKREIFAPGIDWAGKVVVLITLETKNHEWVNWEIEYAHKHNKLIIGVWAHGSAGCELPEALKNHHDALVSWNADRILEAFESSRIEGSRISEEPRWINATVTTDD